MKRPWMPILPTICLLVTGSLLTMGCEQEPTTAPTKADDERWQNFQETNKKDLSTAMSAYEKRQQQLAEQKKGGANKTDVKATPAPAESENKQ